MKQLLKNQVFCLSFTEKKTPLTVSWLKEGLFLLPQIVNHFLETSQQEWVLSVKFVEKALNFSCNIEKHQNDLASRECLSSLWLRYNGA